ncbi:MAG: hypothetical protein AAB515_04050 [Patescibacteria group bacterium]
MSRLAFSASRNRAIQVNWAVLAVVEGTTDRAFLNYLKHIYKVEEASISVRVICAFGVPDEVLRRALKEQAAAEFDVTLAVVDETPHLRSTLEQQAQERNIKLVVNRPCIEGVLLKTHGRGIGSSGALRCKTLYQANYLDKKSQQDAKLYRQIMSKEMIEEARKRIPELNLMVQYLCEKVSE